MRHERINAVDRTLLRFMTCGLVDDGKSTLIGRLLNDSQALCDDQAEALAIESKKFTGN
jgi:bifunctional enzyme CysN/CysC